MAYITNFNASRILQQADLKGIKIQERGLFRKSIYFFNWYEELFLKVYQEMLENPEYFFGKVYQKIEGERDEYIFTSPPKAPAYHESLDCPLLHSDYKNFIIPEEIRNRGPEKVSEFRKWFSTNQDLYEKDAALFQMRLNAKWKIVVPLNEIEKSNSGVVEIKNQSLTELIAKISELLDQARNFVNSSSKNKQMLSTYHQKYAYLGLREDPLEKNNTPYPDEDLKDKMEYFEKNFKRPVKNLLLEYYRMTFNPDLQFDGKLLEGVGFTACSQCAGEFSTFEKIN